MVGEKYKKHSEVLLSYSHNTKYHNFHIVRNLANRITTQEFPRGKKQPYGVRITFDNLLILTNGENGVDNNHISRALNKIVKQKIIDKLEDGVLEVPYDLSNRFILNNDTSMILSYKTTHKYNEVLKMVSNKTYNSKSILLNYFINPNFLEKLNCTV